MRLTQFDHDSDVRVLSVEHGYRCEECTIFNRGNFHGDAAGMLGHLQRHVAAGHLVPASVLAMMETEVATTEAHHASLDADGRREHWRAKLAAMGVTTESVQAPILAAQEAEHQRKVAARAAVEPAVENEAAAEIGPLTNV